MNIKEPLYTEKNNCQDCYKCLKECPLKAINICNSSASIIYHQCVYCGHCIEICPVKAKKVRNDFDRLLAALRQDEKIIISLAPSYISELKGVSIEALVSTFKEAGFYGVSETALGAEEVARQTKDWLDKQPNGVYFSSCCPSTVLYICKYHQEQAHKLAPIDSPMVAHGKMLKKLYGENTKVLFIGPCISKKKEADMEPSSIDFAITFQEMFKMFDLLGVDFSFSKPEVDDQFIPQRASIGNLYPIDGGMLTNMMNDINTTDATFMTFSGYSNLNDILNDYQEKTPDRKLFLELMFCPGGCIKGPGIIEHKSIAEKRIDIITDQKKDIDIPSSKPLFSDISLDRTYHTIQPVISINYEEEEILEALRSVNKLSEKDELNCAGCGYDNCREFAKALVDGRAERSMCVSFMRSSAYDKSNVLMQKMPYGVAIIDEDLKLVDSNAKFAQLLGEESAFLYESNPGLRGADSTKLVPFYKLFHTVLMTGNDIVEQDVRFEDNLFTVSVFSVQKHHFICAIVQNMREPEVQTDLVLTRTREVIMENMKVVQKIAHLLGENASFTEAMLNSIVESHNLDEEK